MSKEKINIKKWGKALAWYTWGYIITSAIPLVLYAMNNIEIIQAIEIEFSIQLMFIAGGILFGIEYSKFAPPYFNKKGKVGRHPTLYTLEAVNTTAIIFILIALQGEYEASYWTFLLLTFLIYLLLFVRWGGSLAIVKERASSKTQREKNLGH